MRVLLAEDDPIIADGLVRALRKAGYAVDRVDNGLDADTAVLSQAFDLLILDLGLPKMPGIEILRRLRARKCAVPVLILTAQDGIEERVRGLDAGADDYLTKPFALEELLARTRALGRRFTPALSGGDELRCGDLVLDTIAHTARVGVTALDLTATEWSLLEYLARHRGQALTRDQILDYVWSYDRAVQTSMVDLYISYLRRKLNTPEADCSGMIQTVRGLGYRLDVVA